MYLCIDMCNVALRSQDMPATSTPYNGMLNGNPAGVPRPSSFGSLTHPPPSSSLEEDPFMARRSDEPSVARFPSSPPPEKYTAEQSIHPSYIYDSGNHHAEGKTCVCVCVCVCVCKCKQRHADFLTFSIIYHHTKQQETTTEPRFYY